MIKIIVVGDAIIDHYLWGEINRQSPEDISIPVVDIEKEEYRLGGALNVAANIRSIGENDDIDVSISAPISSFTNSLLRKKNIGASPIEFLQKDTLNRPDTQELVKTRIIDIKTNKQLIRLDNSKKYQTNDFYKYKNFDRFDVVVVSDYCKGFIDENIKKTLKDYKGLVFVDSKNPDLSFWDDIENCFIKMNEKEWKASTKFTNHPLIVTMGDAGAMLRYIICANFSVESVKNPDVVGCGDVFLAGLVVDYTRNKDLQSAIEFANMCAGLSANQQGTVEVRL